MHGVSLDRSLEDLDESLRDAGRPLKHRPLDCFKKLYGSVPDGRQRQELFAPIITWYTTKYGEAMTWDGIVARFPILIQGEIYLAKAHFIASGQILVNCLDTIENLAEGVVESIDREELRTVLERLTFGTRNHHSLYNLSIDDDCLAENDRELVRRALHNLENAAVTLKHTGDTQSSIVQSHEAAEKFLKAALRKSGSSQNLKSFGHDIPKIFKLLVQQEPHYSCLSLPVENLQKLSPSMELRYSTVPRSVDMAAQAYHGALYVCGMLAQMWLFDKARGTKRSAFNECRFYVDGAASTFYCKKADADSATLTFFQSNEYLGTQMADLILDQKQSVLYLEVTDAQEDEQLRLQLIAHLRNPGRKVSPAEIGVKVTEDAEGSYVTSRLTRRLGRPKVS